MKTCPTCSKIYKDDEQNFCLEDGATLIEKRRRRQRHSPGNEIAAVILLAAAVLVFLCIVSFTETDPTANTASSEPTRNWIGVVGALIADRLLQYIGLAAYLAPAMIGLAAWRVFNSDVLRPRVSRVIGFVLFFAGASSLLSLAGFRGGILGGMIIHVSLPLLSVAGSGVVMGAVFLTSLLLITDLSFLGTYGHFEVAWGNFKIHFDDWKQKRAERKAEKLRLVHERMEKRKLLREEGRSPSVPTITLGNSSETANPKIQSSGNEAAGFAKAVNESAAESVPTLGASDTPPDTIFVGNDAPAMDRNIPITLPKTTGELKEDYGDAAAGDMPEGHTPNFEEYILPSIDFLIPPEPHVEHQEYEMFRTADLLKKKTSEFNVAGDVVHISPGPVVTTYEFRPSAGVKYSRVTGLVDDLCLGLKAESIRIDRIPGKAYVGIEVPNTRRETIRLRDVIDSDKFNQSKSLLTIALGKTIDGRNYVTDLAKMPHLLIAGATGAGKSVGVNSLVVSILYKAKPDEVKFIMVDPKRLELGVYANIPHLATPIITDPKRAAISLRWAVAEMERRYKELAGYGVRNIDGYNAEAKRRNLAEQWDDNGEAHRHLPYIVIIIDELADLMMISGKEVEEAITRLAQMARAVGIHLVLATQRPSVDVITGLIKANFPARISFRVSSKVDSRTIIDGNGAEALLGKGDMLFLPPASSQVIRVHGAYVDEKEIAKIVNHIKAQGKPEYDAAITKSDEEMEDSDDLPGRRDPLFKDALRTVVGFKRGSTSLLQRHLRIGYGRAAAILDAMVREGYIGEMDGSTRARPVLQKAYDDIRDFDEMDDE